MGLLGLLTCCKSEPRPGIVVSVTGREAKVVALDVRASLEGQGAMPIEQVTGDLDLIGLRLPAGSRGVLRIEVDGLDEERCLAQRGEGTVTISGDVRHEVTVPLTSLGTRDCTPRGDGGGGGDGGTPAEPGQICSKEGWCWEYPLPQGADLYGVFALSESEVWAVGARGTILRQRGGRWELVPSNTKTDLVGIWGTSASDLWVIGEKPGTNAKPEILRWDGARWDPVANVPARPDTRLRAVWGFSKDDVWVVGEAKTVLHWQGSAWEDKSPDLFAGKNVGYHGVHGTAANDVWAVGDIGEQNADAPVIHWNGSMWTESVSNTKKVGVQTSLRGVWAVSANQAWAVGPGGLIVAWDGTKWSKEMEDKTVLLRGVWASDGDSIWAAGRDTTGTDSLFRRTGTWAKQTVPEFLLQAIHGTGATNIWAVGEKGAITHWNGAEWVSQPGISQLPRGGGLYAAFAVASKDLWAVGVGHPNRRALMLHLEPKGVSVSRGMDGEQLNSVWFSGKDDGWSVGETDDMKGAIYRFSGGTWSRHQGEAKKLYGIWGSGASDVWAAGLSGTLLRWEGATWSARGNAGMGDFNSVSGSAPDHVWAVGSSAYRFDGTNWTQQATGLSGGASDVWARTPTDVWAHAGDAFRHWDGSSWSQIAGPVDGDTLQGVQGSSASDIWAVGGVSKGAVLHWDGKKWCRQETGLAHGALSNVAVVGPGETWVVGDSAIISRKTPAPPCP